MPNIDRPRVTHYFGDGCKDDPHGMSTPKGKNPATVKETYKTQSHYAVNLKTGEYDSIQIIQEENIKGRNAIQIKFDVPERWRSPEETVAMLREVSALIEKMFI